jgi:hypothetical protein
MSVNHSAGDAVPSENAARKAAHRALVRLAEEMKRAAE